MLPTHVSPLVIMKIALVVTVAIGMSGGLLAWRERPEPGSIPLTFLLAGQCWWSAMLFFRINATSVGSKLFWANLSWLGVVVIPVAWLFFCLEYTGHGRYLRARYVILASIIPVITVLLGLTDSYHSLMYVDTIPIERNGELTISRTPGLWFWVIAGYTYLLGLLGAIPILQFIGSDVDTFRGQSFSLLIGLFAPWLTNGLFLMGVLPTGGIDPTPVAFSVSGVAYLGALTRFQLFETSPTPIRSARRSIFNQMQQGAIVLDRNHFVVDMNQRAATIIEQDLNGVLGRPIETSIPELESHIKNSDPTDHKQNVFRPDNGSNAYDVSVNRLTDIHGRTIGDLIILHDITDHIRQQQRLEVLNRVLRHNIRTNVQVIVAGTDYLADKNSESKAETVIRHAYEIKNLSEQIRTAINLFEESRNEPQPMQLTPHLQECVSSIREEYPDVTIDCNLPSQNIYVDNILDVAFSHIIENAAEHNTNSDPTLWIETDLDDDYVRISVADNGPGISDRELSLLQRGTETPLEHGTGFGLPLSVWATDLAGGQLTFEENEPTGTIITIEVPVLSKSGTSRDESSLFEVEPRN